MNLPKLFAKFLFVDCWSQYDFVQSRHWDTYIVDCHCDTQRSDNVSQCIRNRRRWYSYSEVWRPCTCWYSYHIIAGTQGSHSSFDLLIISCSSFVLPMRISSEYITNSRGKYKQWKRNMTYLAEIRNHLIEQCPILIFHQPWHELLNRCLLD